MKIRMNTLMAGPHGVRHPGEVCIVSEEEAEMLVSTGHAEAVEEAKEETPQLDAEAVEEADAAQKPGGKKK